MNYCLLNLMIRNKIKQILYDNFGYEELVILDELLKIIEDEKSEAYEEGYKEGVESQKNT